MSGFGRHLTDFLKYVNYEMRNEIDIFQSINRKFFVAQNVEILQGGCGGGGGGGRKKLF
jgi:hypothetical protein